MSTFDFAPKLIQWYHQNKRELPWRNTKDPYKIWLSEVILQQTRVKQGMPYFLAFTKNYPTVEDLAKAEESEVLRLWQGLGYYSRARNMHATAQYITRELDGKFPSTFDTLLKLKGVGTYTAAAIASFAFDEVVPVVDGNVYRVLSRVFGIEEDIASTQGKKTFDALAHELVPSQDIANYNQAIMEFGAIHCKPQNPDCMFCIFTDTCEARAAGKQAQLPVKLKKVKIKKRAFHYFVLEHEGHILVKERSEKGIWQGLYDFHLVETDKITDFDTLINNGAIHVLEKEENFLLNESKNFKHILTHQHIFAKFFHLHIKSAEVFHQLTESYGLKSVEKEDLQHLPKPILIHNYLKDYIY